MQRPATPHYSRFVSFSERSFFNGPTIRLQALSIQYVFEGSGSLTIDELRAAVAVASEANPGSRLVLRGFLKWLRWESLGALPSVAALPPWDADGELPAALQDPFDVKKGPTCQILFTQAAQSRLVFRCFHGVMDGRGLIHFAEEVFRALRGEPCQGAPSMISDSELIEELAPNQFRKARPLKYRSPVAITPSKRRGVVGHRLVVEGKVPSIAAKIAAALTQLAQTQPDPAISFMTPVDIRVYKPGIQSMGNLTSSIYFEGKAGQDWNSIQSSILIALARKQALRREPSERIVLWLPLWVTKILINSFEYTQARKQRYIFSAYISHINLPKKTAFSGPGFHCETMFAVAPTSEFFPLGVSAITLEDKTHLTIFGPHSIVSKEQLKKVADCIFVALNES